MIDWRLATVVGDRLLGTPAPGAADPLPGDLIAMAQDAERRVVAYTGMEPVAPLSPPEAVDRAAWLRANLGSMRRMLDPATTKLSEGLDQSLGFFAGAVRSAGGAAIGAEVGGLAGYLARRVLGQYDLTLVDPGVAPRLLFVAPNLRETAERLDVELESLVAWVCFHEVTHAVQFGAVDWLRPHLGGLLEELLSGLDLGDLGLGSLKVPSGDDVKAFAGALRSGELLTLVGGPERQGALDRVQATMALVEGHAEHVMDVVGAEALPDLPELREKLDRRREGRDGLLRWFEKLIGLDAKMRQYKVGKAFCDAVVEQAGPETLHRAWESPNLLPSLAELEAPALWLSRVG